MAAPDPCLEVSFEGVGFGIGVGVAETVAAIAIIATQKAKSSRSSRLNTEPGGGLASRTGTLADASSSARLEGRGVTVLRRPATGHPGGR